MSEFISWDNRYSIGIKIVDDQHKHLISLTNTLHNACRSHGHSHEVTKQQFREAIQSAVNYVQVHFSTEEKLMERTNYPGLSAHVIEHKKFIQKVLENIKAFEEGKTFVPNAFVRFLKDWILEHIAIQDRQMGLHFLQLKK